MSEGNQRHYENMISLIGSFERAEVGLGSLVDRLEGLLNMTEGLPLSWKNTFLGHWGKLEDIRAFALDQGGPSHTPKTSAIIADALSHIKLMVLNGMDSPTSVRER